MKPLYLLVVGLAALLAACGPSSRRELTRTTEEAKRDSDPQVVRRATRNMASTVADLQARSGQRCGPRQSAGDLWIEIDRLKRDGREVRNVEWRVSELEESLRRNRGNDASRRHILNDLSYEIEVLKRRNMSGLITHP
ncbi:MAG TPA: hypothetical protein PKM73_21780 [Verrucomicrobiota bacterium]|nr:hypothetical protein [Verrucomicrobiota bacterium]